MYLKIKYLGMADFWFDYCLFGQNFETIKNQKVEMVEIYTDLVWIQNIFALFKSRVFSFLQTKGNWNNLITNWRILNMEQINSDQSDKNV